MIVRLHFEKGKPVAFEREYVEHNTDEVGVRLLGSDERKKIEEHQEQLNCIIADDEKLQNAFDDYVQQWKPVMNTWIQPYKGKYLPSLYKKGLLPSIISKNKKLLFTNLIRCEAHRDILINSINPNK